MMNEIFNHYSCVADYKKQVVVSEDIKPSE